MGEGGEFGHEGGDEQVPVSVVDVFAVALEGGVDLLFAEVQGIGPADVPVFHEGDVGVCAVVPSFEEGVVESGVHHQQNVVQVQRVRDGVLVEQDLLVVLAQLLRDLVEVDDAVVDRLFVCVVLADPQSLGDRLQALLQVVHFQVDEGGGQDAVVDLVAHQAHFRLLLEQITQRFVEVAVHLVGGLNRSAASRPQQRLEVAGFEGVVVLCQLEHLLRQCLRVCGGVVLEVELDFFD